MKRTSLIFSILNFILFGTCIFLFILFILGNCFGIWIIYNLAGYVLIFLSFIGLNLSISTSVICILQKRKIFVIINLIIVILYAVFTVCSYNSVFVFIV